MKTLTIVTVTYNAAASLQTTIDSIASQIWKDWEWIVVDGGSQDATVEIARSSGIASQIISEKDNGIFDGMNKGIQRAESRWIVFMNAGDTFYDSETLASLQLDSREPSCILYGDCVLVTTGGHILRKARPFTEHPDKPWGIGICHQSIYCPTAWMKAHPFLWKEYPICADYRFVRSLWEEGKKLEHIPRPLSYYEYGDGNSSKPDNYRRTLKENARIAHLYPSLTYVIEWIKSYFK